MGGSIFDDIPVTRPPAAQAPTLYPPTPTQQRVVTPTPPVAPPQPPTPIARTPVQSTPAPAPDSDVPAGFERFGTGGRDPYYQGADGQWRYRKTGRLVTSKRELAGLTTGTVTGGGGGGGGGGVAGNLPQLLPGMKAYEPYTLPDGTVVIPEPNVNKYGITYDLKKVKPGTVGPAKPGDLRTRTVDGRTIHERADEKGLWVPDPAHAQPLPGKYSPGSEIELDRGGGVKAKYIADEKGIPRLVGPEGQPIAGPYKPGEEVTIKGKLYIADAKGIPQLVPKEGQPTTPVPSRVRPDGTLIDPETAKAEDLEYRKHRIKHDAEFMAERQKEQQAADQRRISVDYLGGLISRAEKAGTLGKTGPGTQWWLPAAQALVRFGALPDDVAKDVSGLRVFEAISTSLQQQMRIAGTGAISDKDMILFGKMIPTVEDSPEANRMMIAAMKQMDDYGRKVWRARQAYYDKNKSLEGWEEHRDSRPELQSVFRRVPVSIMKDGKEIVNPDWDKLRKGELYVVEMPNGEEEFRFK